MTDKSLPVKLNLYQNLIGVGLGLLGVLIFFRNWLWAMNPNSLWADMGDSRLIYWITSWVYHVLFELHNPSGLWNANSFYPEANSLAYSESLLSLQIFYAPLRLLGFSATLALQLSLMLTLVVSSWLTYTLLSRIGIFSSLENGLITYVSIFGLSTITYYLHYQLFGFSLAFPYFLSLYLYLKEYRLKDLLITCTIFSIGLCFSTYLGPILVAISVIVALPMLVFHPPTLTISAARKIGIGTIIQHLLVVTVFGIGCYFIQIRPYLQVTNEHSHSLAISEVIYFSANIQSFLNSLSMVSYWYAPTEVRPGQNEFMYAPGIILSSWGYSFLVYTIYRSTRRFFRRSANVNTSVGTGEVFESRPGKKSFISEDFLYFTLAIFLGSLILSWGPYLKWNYQVYRSIPLPLYWVARVIPGFAHIRVPGRMGMFLGMPLAIFMIALVHQVVQSTWKRLGLVSILFLGLVIEAWPTYVVYPFSSDPSGLYRHLASYKLEGVPLIELPVTMGDRSVELVLQQLVGSTFHWSKLVVGYGQMFSPDYDRLKTLDEAFRNGDQKIQGFLYFARRRDISYFLIHLDRYPSEASAQWLKLSQSDQACTLFNEDNVLFFRIGKPCTP